jgi:hypothetical protein
MNRRPSAGHEAGAIPCAVFSSAAAAIRQGLQKIRELNTTSRELTRGNPKVVSAQESSMSPIEEWALFL